MKRSDPKPELRCVLRVRRKKSTLLKSNGML